MFTHACNGFWKCSRSHTTAGLVLILCMRVQNTKLQHCHTCHTLFTLHNIKTIQLLPFPDNTICTVSTISLDLSLILPYNFTHAQCWLAYFLSTLYVYWRACTLESNFSRCQNLKKYLRRKGGRTCALLAKVLIDWIKDVSTSTVILPYVISMVVLCCTYTVLKANLDHVLAVPLHRPTFIILCLPSSSLTFTICTSPHNSAAIILCVCTMSLQSLS